MNVILSWFSKKSYRLPYFGPLRREFPGRPRSIPRKSHLRLLCCQHCCHDDVVRISYPTSMWEDVGSNSTWANFLSNIYSIYDYSGNIWCGFLSYTVHMYIYMYKRKKGQNMHPAEVRKLLVLLKPLLIAILS